MFGILGAVSGLIAAGAYLKWATSPVLIAFKAGRHLERLVASPARFAPAAVAFYRAGRRDRAAR